MRAFLFINVHLITIFRMLSLITIVYGRLVINNKSIAVKSVTPPVSHAFPHSYYTMFPSAKTDWSLPQKRVN